MSMIRVGSGRGALLALTSIAGCAMRMPGESHSGDLPALTTAQDALAAELRVDVQRLAGDIGERHIFRPDHLAAAEEYLAACLTEAGYGVRRHWSFWKQGYPSLMVTDTAPYRYRHYHEATDTPDKIDYERLARVVTGLEAVVSSLAGPPAP